MTKIDFYKKYSNSVIKIPNYPTISYDKFVDKINNLIFELDDYSKYPEIKSSGLVNSGRSLFEIIIPKYPNERVEYTYNEIVTDINSLKE